MIYTGIGSRETPKDIQKKMVSIGRYMASLGWTLRSGGAEGADESFERGCIEKNGKMEIYLPYQLFRKNESRLYGTTKEARLFAKNFHPNWEVIGSNGRDFIARNGYQVMGLDLKTPTNFIVCWTPDGKITGGTGQALRIAAYHSIPVLNFGSLTSDELESQLTRLMKDYNP